jgi:hypothetical protein
VLADPMPRLCLCRWLDGWLLAIAAAPAALLLRYNCSPSSYEDYGPTTAVQ